MSRDRAKKLWAHAKLLNGQPVVDKNMMARIKTFSADTFGSTDYWPWLACYTELRKEFIEGWIPDDYYRFELLPEINPEKFIRFSEAKTIDHRLFHGLVITPVLFRSRNQYFNGNSEPQSAAEASRIISELDHELVIKPEDGRGGSQILFKHSSDLKLNDLPGGINLVIQKVVKQHAEMNALYPYSINTFRVMTFLNDKGEIEIKFIIIRFGRGGARVDNASGGGGWIFVHANGLPSRGAYDKWGFDFGSCHPDTGKVFADLSLPFIPEVTKVCRQAHRRFPYTRLIGWDVFVNEDGKAKLIEWNANNPFWEAIEARYGPFLKELIM